MALFESNQIKSTDWKWSFKDYPKDKNGLKVFSCFACGGGSTMGYKLAGCEVIGDLEIDPKMNELYVKNHNPKYNYCMDIRDFNNIPNEELPEELFNLDILDGSPPCTTFSMVGDREKSWGKKKKFREGQKEQTLDDLSFVFIETVNKLKPKVVIMENVEGLIQGNAIKYAKDIYISLEKCGYKVNYYLLKGETMGVPQKRHRVFFIAVRNDVDFNFDALDMNFNYKPITYGEIKSGSGISLNQNNVKYKWLCKSLYPDRDLGETLRRLGQKEKFFSNAILWDNEVAKTQTASSDLYYRGSSKTYISREDIISLQTFPTDYNFDDNSCNVVHYVCGMSVPPIMIKRIVTRLLETNIFKENKNNEN